MRLLRLLLLALLAAAPSARASGGSGMLYVTNFGGSPGAGQVLRLGGRY